MKRIMVGALGLGLLVSPNSMVLAESDVEEVQAEVQVEEKEKELKETGMNEAKNNEELVDVEDKESEQDEVETETENSGVILLDEEKEKVKEKTDVTPVSYVWAGLFLVMVGFLIWGWKKKK